MKYGIKIQKWWFGKINPVMLKRISVYLVLFLLAIKTNAGPLDLWGIDITKSRAEITWCKIEQLEDNKIFSQLKICAEGYTFANDRTLPVYTCFYGDETACFLKATEIISSKFGDPLDVYSYNENNPYSVKAPFLNIWKYNKDDKHYVLLLFGSGEGMTLDVIHFISERKLRAYILSTIKSFHFSVKPILFNYLDK